mmetsp:Transcript_157243/g.293359  ORF Transcript_157243/g.293359 Transcript_157243/m.293359 type:complete len:214 (+) Transcript_157243:1012-1653(+)
MCSSPANSCKCVLQPRSDGANSGAFAIQRIAAETTQPGSAADSCRWSQLQFLLQSLSVSFNTACSSSVHDVHAERSLCAMSHVQAHSASMPWRILWSTSNASCSHASCWSIRHCHVTSSCIVRCPSSGDKAQPDANANPCQFSGPYAVCASSVTLAQDGHVSESSTSGSISHASCVQLIHFLVDALSDANFIQPPADFRCQEVWRRGLAVHGF